MSWEVVKQPNGKYARFSTVVMSNTHRNLSKSAMIAALVKDCRCSENEARTLVEQASDGEIIFGAYQSGRL